MFKKILVPIDLSQSDSGEASLVKAVEMADATGATLVLLNVVADIPNLVADRLPPRARRLAEMFALAFVALISAVIVWHGSGIAFDSFERGRTAGTLLDLPMWWSEAAAPLGFLLLGLQAVVEIVKLARGAPLPSHDHGEP